MELLETPLGETEMSSRELSVDRRGLQIPPEPYPEIQVIPEDPKEIAVREGIHVRIQTEIHHENKEAEFLQNEMKFQI